MENNNQDKADNGLTLKTVSELLGLNFFIPSYQRGYRWTDTQVKQMLDDIWQFANPPESKKEKSPFYCLQPIVVKKRNGTDEWEVIDGQQRLTTIFLVIHYFNEMWIGKQKITEPKLSYETRPESSDFMSKLEIEDVQKEEEIKIYQEDKDIDSFHIAGAYKTIHNWVRDKKELDNYKFQSVFLHSTKVIWYEANEDDDAINIFRRLNIGKIPLTNAELVKALFLQRGNFAEEKATFKQIQIASEWDTIEKTLQDDAFWLFIYNPDNPMKYDNRIEYIFDLMKRKTKESEYYYTFNLFYDEFQTYKKDCRQDTDKIWLEIKKYFLTFEEWFKDSELFHYTGYLIDCGKDINSIKEKSVDKTKKEFKDFLKDEIKENVKFEIDELEYDKRANVKKVLLLFNIQTVLQTQKSDMRFPFHKYKSDHWDIEHVRSQTEKSIDGNAAREKWIEDILEYFTGYADIDNAKKEIEQLSDSLKAICSPLVVWYETEKKNSNEFQEYYKQVLEYFKEDKDDNINNISNLALLDAHTNRSYKNALFPVKRKKIIDNDKNGIFVPIATKNLFLKYYSKQFGEVMYWNSSDAEDYLKAIKTTLEEFLPKEDKQ